MRASAFLLFCLFAALPSAWGASSAAEVRTVYLMPMAQGMDQYLANRLTNEGVFEVVTDILRADAIISGHVGKGFETELEEMLRLAEERKAAEAAKQTAEGEEPNAKKGEPADEWGSASSRRVVISSFGRGKGTIFLVDLASRKVLWSTYAVPKNETSKELDKTASTVVDRLEKSLSH